MRKKSLTHLYIGGVSVTPEQVAAARKAVPDCLVSWWAKPKIEYPEAPRRGGQ